MKKDKFGIRYSFYAVLGFLLALLGQPLLCLLLLGFVIMTSDSEWTVKHVMQAFLISLTAYVLQLLQTGVNIVASIPLFGTLFSGMFSLVCAVVNLFVLAVCIFSIVNIVRSGDSGIPWLKSFAEWAFGKQATGATTADNVKHYTTKLIAGAKDLASKVMPSAQPSVETEPSPDTQEQTSAESEQLSVVEAEQTSDKPEHASDIEEQLFDEERQTDVPAAEASVILTPLEDAAFTEAAAPADVIETHAEAYISHEEGVRKAAETLVPSVHKTSRTTAKASQAKKASHTPVKETAEKKAAEASEQKKTSKAAKPSAETEKADVKAPQKKPPVKRAPKTPSEKSAAKSEPKKTAEKETAKSAKIKADSKD